MDRTRRLALGLVAGVLLFSGGVWLGTALPARQSAAVAGYAERFAQVAPSVLSVLPADGSRGAGVAVAPRRVLTARHLVVDQVEVELRTRDGRPLRGRVLGSDVPSDLALLEVEEDLVPLPLVEHRLRVGDPVFTVGNPFGLGHSLAVGVVSGASRRLEGEAGEGPQVDLLQLSLATNPGNSGGPVLDAQGRLIGVLTGIHAEGQSIAFAVPSSAIEAVLPALEQPAGAPRAYLGIRVRQESGGLMARQIIPGSPAAMADVRVGDLLLSLDGQPVETLDALAERVGELGVGHRATVKVLRDGAPREIGVTLVDWRMVAERPALVAGMTLIPRAGTGGAVSAVSEGSVAQVAGMRVGDVILAVSGRPMRAPVETQAWLEAGSPAPLRVMRGGDVIRIPL